MKFNINKYDLDYILKNVRNINDVIDSDNLNDILDVIDSQITYDGFDENYDLNEKGEVLQKIYDRIFYEN